MKHLLYLLFCFTLLSMSCEKDEIANDLVGNWQLAEVYDKNTATTSPAPAGIELHFTGNNSFTGNTLRNSFGGDYSAAGTKITFMNYVSTQVVEDSWGTTMFTVLNACLLQSLAPCAPSNYSIQGATLKINTPLRYDITLKRM